MLVIEAPVRSRFRRRWFGRTHFKMVVRPPYVFPYKRLALPVVPAPRPLPPQTAKEQVVSAVVAQRPPVIGYKPRLMFGYKPRTFARYGTKSRFSFPWWTKVKNPPYRTI